MPCCVWIRDLEGTELLRRFGHQETLHQLSERARQSTVYYSREQGRLEPYWLFAFINNISEAIFFIAEGNSALEHVMRTLKDAIVRWQSINGPATRTDSIA
ncbi:hypothetical protein O9993_00430 [Vibrio lentus]|nr:hypothetical protein [Vibrio lentus]